MSALSSIRNGLTSSGSSIIVGIIIFGLVATFGGFLGEGSVLSNNSILTVNGKSITPGEFSLEYGRISDQLSDSDQDLSDKIIEDITRDSIVFKELYAQSAIEAGLNIDDKKLNSLIVNDPSFYTNESFDVELFKGFLSRLGMTPDSFKEYIKSRYLASDLQNLLNKEINLSNDLVRNFIEANNQTRDISFSRIILAEEASKETISEKEISDYYDKNKFLYISPLNISYRFLNLNQDAFNKSLSISEEEISEEMEAIMINFLPQKKVNHIEISYDESNKEDKLNEIKGLLTDLTNNKLSFEDAVRDFSTDLSTKNNNGDLGYTDGTIFPDEFEEVLSKIKINQLSEIIDLTTSFHIIKYTEQTNSNFTREDIVERITFAKASEKLEEALNFVDENIFISDLESISDNLNLEIENTFFEEENIFVSKFNDIDIDEIEEGGLYGPFQEEEGYLVIAIDKIEEQGYKAFDEVNSQIEGELKLLNASKKTDLMVQSSIENLKNNTGKITKYSEIKRDNFLLPLEITRKLFSFETKENDIFSLILDNGDAYVVKLDKVNDNKGVITTKDLNEGKNYLSSVYKEIIRQSFTTKLRESSTVN
ncbi:SurA N-terminal domain-containing protein [SAR86 cluster bacterium]|nr:SurA N-terminal domain-containing protein [SAR86 cluster bacterium]